MIKTSESMTIAFLDVTVLLGFHFLLTCSLDEESMTVDLFFDCFLPFDFLGRGTRLLSSSSSDNLRMFWVFL